MPQDFIDLDNSSVSPEQVYAELEAVLRSPGLERSERLQKFLRYICELTLKGEAARINEYLIGSEVFLKGADYNPNEDSIVRRQAHTLRQKLQDYYSGEGRDHPLRIELPVGRYVPVFRRHGQTVVTPAAAPRSVEQSTAPATRLTSDRHRLAVVLAGAGIFAAGLAAGILWTSNSRDAATTQTMDAAAQEIWGPWLSGSGGAVICFSNPLTAVVKHFDKPLPPDSVPKRFPMHPTEEAVFRDVLRLPAGGRIYFTPVINQAKMGEAISGVFLARFFAAAGKPVNSTQSRFLSWNDLRQQNLILLGHNEAN